MSIDCISLGDIADFRNGLNYSRENMGVGLKVINVGDFGDRMSPDYESLGEIDPAGVAGDNDLLQEGDLLFVRSNGNRELVGRVMYITALPYPVAYSGFCIRARLNTEQVNPKFYYYLFRCKETRMRLITGGVGANIVNVSQKTLTRFEVVNPLRDIQDKCVFLISAYDDLIAANQRRIQLLEESVRLLYREWFVNLRFPGHESVPVVDGVPDGWEIKKLGDVADIQWGDTSTTKSSYTNEGYKAFSASGQDGKLDHYDFDREGIVLSAIGANCGLTWYTSGKWSCIKNTIRFWATDHITTEFLYVATYGKDFWPKRGAAQPFISQGDANAIQIVCPSRPLVERYSEFTKDVLSQIDLLEYQNQKLGQARDMLLPKLMSGALDVSRLNVLTDDDGWRGHAA